MNSNNVQNHFSNINGNIKSISSSENDVNGRIPGINATILNTVDYFKIVKKRT